MNSYYKNKVKTVERFLGHNQLSFSELIDGWSEDKFFCIRVLEGNLNKADTKYINEKLNLNHLKDSRTPIEYATELLLSWAVEDGVVSIFNSLGFDAKLISEDKNREFLKKPTSSCDILINNQPLELVCDYSGYWGKNGTVELRDNKLLNLKKEDGNLMGLDFKNDKFFLIRDLDSVKSKYISYHFPYKKPAYSIQIPNFYNFSKVKKVIFFS